MNIAEALADRKLLGAGFSNPTTWATWLAVLCAAFGLPLNRQQRRAFTAVAGERKPPRNRVRELWALVGRRAGKSRIAAAIACFFALFAPHNLAAGEIGYVLVVAANKAQAGLVYGYCRGFVESSPVLAQEIQDTTAHEIRLRNGVVIAVHANSFRSVRGKTILCLVADEVAYWRDELSASPDVETYRAVMPSLAASGGMWVGISTGYRKTGLLYTKHRDHFGIDGDVLVVSGSTRDFNPSIDQKLIDHAMANDPEAAGAEWLGEFRNDITAFLSDTSIDAAIHSRPLELPPQTGIRYAAFVDPSGGRHDHFVIAIGHHEQDRCVVDVVRGRRPPFDPREVTREFAQLARSYGCKGITSDAYSAEWAASEWRACGMQFRQSDLNKSELYLESLPLWNRGAIRIPNHPILVRELSLLERRTSRVGRDIVDHGRAGSDDYANALCGVAHLVAQPRRNPVAVTGYYATNRGTLDPRSTLDLIRSMTRH